MGHTIERPATRAFEEFRLPALAFEREAADRYREFETWFADHGHADFAAMCARFGKLHRDEYHELAEASSVIAASAINAARRPWIRQAASQRRTDEFFYRLAGARQLLEIALAEESEAVRFFEQTALEASDEASRRLASDFAAASRECACSLAAAVEHTVPVDWEQLIAAGGGPSLALGAERRLRKG